jgi:predicted ATP-dependent endonuclease of OLD family
MKIKEIQIQNFRSIENISIDFKENPRVLVGINESGKTNIIEALRLINPEFQILDTDIRLTEKGPAEKSEILFIFKLENKELEDVYQRVCKQILSKNLDKPILRVNGVSINLKEFLYNYFNEGLYEIDIKGKSRRATYWEFDKKIEFLINFKKPRTGVNFTFQNEKGETLNISSFKLIDLTSYSNIPIEQLEEANIEIFNDIFGNAITEIVYENLPRVIYWKYEDKYLLPPLINISSFASNPENCIPLMNMFILAGIPKDKIGEKINETRKKFPIALRSFLREVASKCTKYLKNAWPEYRNIKISLEPSGENIECGVEGEKTIQHFPLRSDGFKRFISILLMLSIPSEQKLLNNALILIDEAEASLHPSGCRYLMKQLIKLAESNYVLYSTHSIFMIDRENIKRHYIVEKKNEITTIKEADETTYRDEEVLYKALGTSAYEILEEKNILFEGWYDKKLFEISLQKNKELEKFFKNVGKSHSIGAKSIKYFLPLLELSNRKIFILSDSDQVAIQEQKEFKIDKGYGVWKRYEEIFEERKIVTSEDFIKKEILQNKFCGVLRKFGIDFQEDEFKFPESGRLNYIKNWLTKKKIAGENQKEIIIKLKQSIFSKLNTNAIEEDYFKFLQKLKKEIEKL